MSKIWTSRNEYSNKPPSKKGKVLYDCTQTSKKEKYYMDMHLCHTKGKHKIIMDAC